jgi:hypothetical protein
MHYMQNGDRRAELYDFENDRAEQTDLAGSEIGSQMLEHCRQTLATVLSRNRSAH